MGRGRGRRRARDRGSRHRRPDLARRACGQRRVCSQFGRTPNDTPVDAFGCRRGPTG
jgi:hypothetical protein